MQGLEAGVIGTETLLVRVRRPNGREVYLRVPYDHLERVMDLAAGEFGDPSIILGGPKLRPVEK